MNRILAGLTAAVLLLAGCAASQQATVTTDLANAKAGLRRAVTAYGVAKGLADVAKLADPSLVPLVVTAEAVLDPLQASATKLLADASADVPAVEALTVEINGQVADLTVTAAPAVRVVAGH